MAENDSEAPPEPTETGQPASGPAGSPPPAAKKVLTTRAAEGDAAEVVELRRKLSEADSARKRVETRAAELEDENVRLRTPPSPRPAPQKRAALTAYEAYAEEGPGEA